MKISSAWASIAPRLINDLSKNFGLTTQQAAGVVGQLGHESGGFGSLQEINPLIPGSRGGYGYAQWTGPRRRAFEQFAAANNLDPTSYDANFGFLSHELSATPEGRALDAVRSAPDAYSAGRAFTDTFLRPGIPGYQSRDNWTNKALSLIGENGDVPTMAYNESPRRSPAMNAIDQQTTGSTQPSMGQAPAQPAKKGGPLSGIFGDGGFLDMSDPRTLIALQLISNGQRAPGEMFDGIPQIAAYGAKMNEAKQEKADALQSQNATAEWLRSRDPDLAALVDSKAMKGNEALNEYYHRQRAQQEEANWRGRVDYQSQSEQNNPLNQIRLQSAQQELADNQRQRAEDEVAKTKTREWLGTNAPELADAVDARMITAADAFKLKTMGGGNEYDKRKKAAADLGIGENDPNYLPFIINGKVPENAVKFDDISNMRKEIHQLPSYKNLSQALPIYRSMAETAGRNTKASDLNLVYGLGKIMDPTSVVREGEMIMVKNTASLPDWLQGAIAQLNGGAALTPETRANIMAEAYGRTQGYDQAFKQDMGQYGGIIQRNGLNAGDIIPDFGTFEPWKPAGTGDSIGKGRRTSKGVTWSTGGS